MKKVLLVVSGVLFLVGCGSDSGNGSGDGDISSSQLSGKVIDGYVSGATVFLDLNNNGKLDDNEPSSISESNGEYFLALSKSDQVCLNYIPVIVDVPIGAIDVDLGEITEPYQLVLPPMAANIEHDSHITPLTTLAWDTMTTTLSKDYFTVGCEGIKNNTELHKELLTALDKSTFDLGDIYNLTQEQIYGDFIENGDTEAHELAMKVVEGYQRSFSERAALIEAGNDVWSYRYIYTAGSEKYEWFLQRDYDWLLEYGYNTPENVEYQGTQGFNSDFSESEISWTRVTEFNFLTYAPDYWLIKKGYYINNYDTLKCEVLINLENSWTDVNNNFVRYERKIPAVNIDSPEECSYHAFDDSDVQEEFIHRVNLGNVATLGFNKGNDRQLSELISVDINDYETVASIINGWNVKWDDEDTFTPEPVWFNKTLEEKFDDRTIYTNRGSQGYTDKTTQFSDGTYIKECAIDSSQPIFSPEACSTDAIPEEPEVIIPEEPIISAPEMN